MAHVPRPKNLKIRSEREDQDGTAYVIVAGAPLHYIGGYGVVGPGAIITLPEGTEPGQWLEAVNPSDVTKVAEDPDKAADLAEAARERKDAKDAKVPEVVDPVAAADAATAATIAAGPKVK